MMNLNVSRVLAPKQNILREEHDYPIAGARKPRSASRPNLRFLAFGALNFLDLMLGGIYQTYETPANSSAQDGSPRIERLEDLPR